MMKQRVFFLALAGIALVGTTLASTAFAQHAGHDHGSARPAAAAGAPAAPTASAATAAPAAIASARAVGVVRKLDPAKLTATIAHEPVRSLNWAAMTMLFKVRDKAVFGKLTVGAKIDFDFVQEGDDYVVTGLK